MAISQTLTTSCKGELLTATHAFATTVIRAATTPDTFKIALYTSTATLDGDTTVYSATNEVVGTGYTAGGATLTGVTVTTASRVAYVTFANASWPTASFTANGALIYNSSQGNKAVAVLSFGGNKTATATTFLITFPANGYLTAVVRIE